MANSAFERVVGCLVCGQANRTPRHIDGAEIACCFQCGSDLQLGEDLHSRKKTVILLCIASLLFLIPGLFLPLLKISKFGHVYVTGVVRGCAELFASGNIFLGTIVLICSIILPLLKITCMVFLCLFSDKFPPGLKAHLYLFIEICGRWGTLDVLLLAILVATVKLGEIVQIMAGSGAIVFSIGVFLSLTASAAFTPRILWKNQVIS
ncbi:MAG: paraquat-inducible protein A [Candidatus Riflebacteria bacterium]|nr:paraquat-inducible protein A [Candidatus Riflebacteria bacterium]